MHDVDRTLREFENTEAEFEALEAETGENEQFLGSVLGGIMGGEMETGETFETHETFLGELGEAETQEQNFTGEVGHEAIFDEVQEMELASELLEVSNEAELEYFLGNLIKRAGKAVGGFVKGPIGSALGSALKAVAKRALPLAGSALGNLIVPGLGGVIGGKLASAAGNAFGLELEGLSPQDREFEVARRFVRFAGAAANRAVRMPPRVPPGRAVKTAIVGAARRYAPGLLQPRATHRRRGNGVGPQSPLFRALDGTRPTAGFGLPYNGGSYPPANYATEPYADDGYSYGAATPSFSRSGRWYRRGRRVILVGI